MKTFLHELGTSWRQELSPPEAVLWMQTLQRFEPAEARAALESCRLAYDFVPTHHQFAEAINGLRRAQQERDRARAAISSAAEWSSVERKRLAKENIGKIKDMLSTIGQHGKEAS